MHTTLRLPRTSVSAVELTRGLIHDPAFCQRHRRRPQDFTRRRHLTFPRMIGLLLQKTVRSLQLHLHDFWAGLGVPGPAVGPSSWCEARHKLRPAAFIELNEKAVLEVLYGPQTPEDPPLRRWRGWRVTGIDSSLLRLPNAPPLGEAYGWVECRNQQGEVGRYPQARLSVLTDVLNRIGLQALLVPWARGERALAAEHLTHLRADDLALLDRGFAAYELWAQFIALGRGFVGRCPTSSFGAVNQLFAQNQAGRSVVTTLRPCAAQAATIRAAGLPLEITVRLVTVRLATGQLEVLATNLLDEARYPTEEFGALYHCRWGIETYYGLLKGRLALEHFTGLSEEAVQQDVFATIFLSNLESLLTRPAQAHLQEKSAALQHRQQVNRAVSFHALKARIFDLLLSDQPPEQVLPQLHHLFLANPVARRPERQVPRRQTSAWRSYHFQRNTRKAVF